MGDIVNDGDLRAHGFPVDGFAQETVRLAEQWVERATGFRFYSHAATFALDGSGYAVLLLPQPVISITSVTEDDAALAATTEYVAYNRRPPDFDDRRYPRLVRMGGTAGTTGRWARGVRNVSVVGTFGFTVTRGSAEVPPEEIKRLVLLITALEIGRVGIADEAQGRQARAYATSLGFSGLSVSLASIAFDGAYTGIRQIDSIVDAHRHPTKASRPPYAFGGGGGSPGVPTESDDWR